MIFKAGNWYFLFWSLQIFTTVGKTEASIIIRKWSFWISVNCEIAQQTSLVKSSSLKEKPLDRAKIAWWTSSYAGGGLPRHRFEIAQIARVTVARLGDDRATWDKGGNPWFCRIRSLPIFESIAKFPRILTVCSTIYCTELESRGISKGTSPFSTRLRVYRLVPEVRAAIICKDSNWSWGKSTRCIKSNIRGITPESITLWIGGSGRIESNFLIPWAAISNSLSTEAQVASSRVGISSRL